MLLYRQQKAFSMLTSLVVIVLMASVGAMVMSVSGKIVKETTTQFQREQAMLLAKSYTEYAIMAVMANGGRNSANQCLEIINGDNVIRSENNGGYEVRVQIAYISNGSGLLNGCPAVRVTDTSTTQGLNIIVDTYVIYNDLDQPTLRYTYHKRTLQKI